MTSFAYIEFFSEDVEGCRRIEDILVIERKMPVIVAMKRKIVISNDRVSIIPI